MSRITDLSAVVISARHCNEFDCKKCRARSAGCGASRGVPASPRTAACAAGRGDAE